ncbi:MAG: outer membrane protein, partial [Sphingomicrobium sp.]
MQTETRGCGMKKYLLAAVAAAAIVTPAQARDGAAYVGIEGGLLFPKDQNGDAFVDSRLTQSPATPLAPGGPADVTFNNGLGVDWKRGYDVDAIAGYDFGMFRLELEIGHKRAKRDGFEASSAFLSGLNASLNRPSASPDLGAPGQPALTQNDFDDNFPGKIGILSGMINALVDFGDEDGLSFYAGGGFGRVRAKALNDRDSAWAAQLIAGVRYAISANIDLGLKYRYFRTGRMNFTGGPLGYGGNSDRIDVGPVGAPRFIDRTNTAFVTPEIEGKFRSHSLLASLIF